MKIGIFGGTFNPVHNGHLIMANHVLQEFELDQIQFIPTYQTAYKKIKHNNDKNRMKMLKLAIAGNKKFKINDIELKNQKISYTYKTVQSLYNKEDKLYLIIGNDWLKEFNTWNNYKEIMNFADLILVRRNHETMKLPKHLDDFKDQVYFSSNTFLEVSSTLIREKISKGLDTRYLVPEKAYQYIRKNDLYMIEDEKKS